MSAVILQEERLACFYDETVDGEQVFGLGMFAYERVREQLRGRPAPVDVDFECAVDEVALFVVDARSALEVRLADVQDLV